MEQAETKRSDDLLGVPEGKPRDQLKDDPEFTAQIEAARSIMEKYKETLRRLADSKVRLS